MAPSIFPYSHVIPNLSSFFRALVIYSKTRFSSQPMLKIHHIVIPSVPPFWVSTMSLYFRETVPYSEKLEHTYIHTVPHLPIKFGAIHFKISGRVCDGQRLNVSIVVSNLCLSTHKLLGTSDWRIRAEEA